MGKQKPERPPDYTQQKAEYADSKYQDRLRQADEWNNAVSNYNSQIGGYQSQYNSLSDTINGLTIRDVNQFAPLSSNLNQLRTGLSSAEISQSKPFFESMVNSPYGAVEVGAPTLNNYNANLRNDTLSGVGTLSGQLQNLQNQRKAEEDRISTFRTGLLGQLGNLNTQLSTTGIGNKAQMDSLKGQLAAIENQRSGFQSTILDQLYPSGFSQIQSGLALNQGLLDDLYSRRAAEENRIRQFSDSLYSGVDNLTNMYNGLTIRDANLMDQLQREIDTRQQSASRFQSELSYDFGNPLNALQALEDQLGGLRLQRSQEENRITDAMNRARQGVGNAEAQLAGADIYNLSNLTALQRAIESGRNDMNSFTSSLDYDFGDTATRLNDVDAALQQLMNQRNTRIGGINNEVDALNAAVQGYDLWNEQGFTNALDQLASQQQALNRFSGRDAGEVMFDIEGGQSAIRNRLNELNQFRGGLESNAQAMLAEFGRSDYNSLEDLANPQSRYDALAAQVSQYGANQAQDELTQLYEILSGARSRIGQNAANSQLTAPNGMQLGEGVSLVAGANGQTMVQTPMGVMTPEQYMALLNSINSQEQQNPFGNTNSTVYV